MARIKGDPKKLLKALAELDRLPLPREGEVQAQVIGYLSARGFFAIRVNSGSRPWTDSKGRKRLFKMNSQPGCSDVLAVAPDGRFLAIEVKRPDGRSAASPEQEQFQAEVRRRGGLAVVVSSVDQLAAFLKEAGYP